MSGAGALRWDGGAMELPRGRTVLVPHAIGECELAAGDGTLEVVRCLPPAP